MGLMDILNGMQNGPRGASRGSGSESGGGGMSPLTMALLGLLAYKAMKSFGGSAEPASSDNSGGMAGSRTQAGGGGLGGLLAGLAGGAGIGGLLSGGLGDLLEQFQSSGRGDAANSWIGTGQNQAISPQDLTQVLTPDQIDFLTQRTGLSRQDLLAGLSEQLPNLVDQLTPDGRLPTVDEMNRNV